LKFGKKRIDSLGRLYYSAPNFNEPLYLVGIGFFLILLEKIIQPQRVALCKNLSMPPKQPELRQYGSFEDCPITKEVLDGE
jgi:hypothetical protein